MKSYVFICMIFSTLWDSTQLKTHLISSFNDEGVQLRQFRIYRQILDTGCLALWIRFYLTDSAARKLFLIRHSIETLFFKTETSSHF